MSLTLSAKQRSKVIYIILLFCSLWVPASFAEVDFDKLREIYSKPSKGWPKAEVDAGINFTEIGRLPSVVFPKNNPYSKEKQKLGEMLFFDGRLSRSKQIACASCHDPDLGWADGRKTSFGHDRQKGRRNAPTIENVGYGTEFFWDGRAASLEEQALMPIQDPIEMNFTLPELTKRLNAIPEYQKAFALAFGDERVTAKRIAMALATFQRTIKSRRSDFDRFLSAGEQKNERTKAYFKTVMSDDAIWGMHLFRTKARCMNCHFGPTFSDNQFHNIGLTYYKREYDDLGLYNHSGNNDDVGKFKTPSLRGIMNTKPWMHNGLFGDMTGLLNFYNAGGVKLSKKADDPMSPETSHLLEPLALNNQEIQALKSFLTAITAYPAVGPAPEFIR